MVAVVCLGVLEADKCSSTAFGLIWFLHSYQHLRETLLLVSVGKGGLVVGMIGIVGPVSQSLKQVQQNERHAFYDLRNARESKAKQWLPPQQAQKTISTSNRCLNAMPT